MHLRDFQWNLGLSIGIPDCLGLSIGIRIVFQESNPAEKPAGAGAPGGSPWLSHCVFQQQSKPAETRGAYAGQFACTFVAV